MNEAAPGRWLVVAACLIVIVTVVAAVVVMGGPSAQREARLDQRRVQDLNRIVRAVGRHVETKQVLPATLQSLAAQQGLRLSIVDPVNGASYGYEVTGSRTYRLCAVFTTDSAVMSDGGVLTEDAWSHGAGPQCFDRKAKAGASAD